jgi:hypothetical protein
MGKRKTRKRAIQLTLLKWGAKADFGNMSTFSIANNGEPF